jgi:hypothetical protein
MVRNRRFQFSNAAPRRPHILSVVAGQSKSGVSRAYLILGRELRFPSAGRSITPKRMTFFP